MFEGGEVGCGEGFGVGEEGDGLRDFGEVDGFDDAFGAACFGGGNGLGVGHARGHAGGGVDEPGFEMGDGLLGVALFAGEDEGCGEGGNVEAEVEESVAMGGEGGGLGRRDAWSEFVRVRSRSRAACRGCEGRGER